MLVQFECWVVFLSNTLFILSDADSFQEKRFQEPLTAAPVKISAVIFAPNQYSEASSFLKKTF